MLRDHADDAEGGIRGAVAHHLAWIEAHPRDARVLFEHRQALDRSERREVNRPVLAEVRTWLERHVEAGAMRDLGPGRRGGLVRAGAGGRARLDRGAAAGRARATLAPALAEAAWRSFRACASDE